MILRSHSKIVLRSQAALPALPTFLPIYEGEEQDVVTFQTHSQKADLRADNDNDLFRKVLIFLRNFLAEGPLQTEVRTHMSRFGKSTPRILSDCKNERLLSFKKLGLGSRVCFEAVREQCGRQGGRGNNKKISIFIMEEDFSSEGSEEMFSESLLSVRSVRTMRSIEVPRLELSLETVGLIYDTPQPFLVNLSLCLFVRYCLARGGLRVDEAGWVLCVATVVAYKLYYDQEIEGLFECFQGVMRVSKRELVDLERCFLEAIDYNTVIRNHDYHFILQKLVTS